MKTLILCLGLVSVAGSAFATAEDDQDPTPMTEIAAPAHGGAPAPAPEGSSFASEVEKALANKPEAYCTDVVAPFFVRLCNKSGTVVTKLMAADPSSKDLAAFKELHDGTMVRGRFNSIVGLPRCKAPEQTAKELCYANDLKYMKYSLAQQLTEIEASLAKARNTDTGKLEPISSSLYSLQSDITNLIRGNPVIAKIIKTQSCRSAKHNGFTGATRLLSDPDYLPDECK